MATKPRRELIDAVLDSLGVLVPGQAPSDEDVGRVDNHLDPVLEQLAALGVVYVSDAGTPNPPSGGAIALSIFLPLADVIAWEVAPAFNLAGDPALKVLADQAEETLRRVGRPPVTRKLLQTDIQLRAGNRRFAKFDYNTGR